MATLSAGPALGIAVVGTYVPRMCGIATFTHDLATVLSEAQDEELSAGELVRVIAINEDGASYDYGTEVSFEIRSPHTSDYAEAAGFINVSSVHVVSIQQEFGIYGGEAGRHVLGFMRELKKPIVSTLHTVLEDHPFKPYIHALRDLCDASTLVVVMAEKARRILVEAHGIPADKIRVIPHGCPDVPFMDPGFYKDQFQLEGRKVLLTFGLLGPGKGIETVIEAMPEVVKCHPDAAYVVLGATHPEVRRSNGETYRKSLQESVAKLGLDEHVFFYNRYVDVESLLEFLLSCDAYVTPYLNREQITSGTLAYAAGCGKAIISTPYWHAEEMLADGRGLLVPFKDPSTLAASVNKVFSDEVFRNQIRKRAYQHSRSSVWSEVARSYLRVFQEAIELKGELTRELALPRTPPEVDLSHLRRLSDNTGALSRAVFATPDRTSGYTTGDNALALIAAVDSWRMTADPEALGLIHTYLSFLYHALHERSGTCGGTLSYERKWVKQGDERALAKVIWALGHAVGHSKDECVLELAVQLFGEALPRAETFTDPTAVATVLIGLHRYLIRFSGASELRRVRERLATRLYEMYVNHRSESWHWLADTVGREAGHLPHALLLSGRWLEQGEMVDCGMRVLNWLFDIQTSPEHGWLSLIGDESGFKRGKEPSAKPQVSRFSQRPVDAAALAGACEEAYLVTREPLWSRRLWSCYAWFLGENDRKVPLYNPKARGVSAGLERTRLNPNLCAEATLSWLMTLMAVRRVGLTQRPSQPPG